MKFQYHEDALDIVPEDFRDRLFLHNLAEFENEVFITILHVDLCLSKDDRWRIQRETFTRAEKEYKKSKEEIENLVKYFEQKLKFYKKLLQKRQDETLNR